MGILENAYMTATLTSNLREDNIKLSNAVAKLKAEIKDLKAKLEDVKPTIKPFGIDIYIKDVIDKIVEEKRKLCPDDIYLNPNDRDFMLNNQLGDFLEFLEKHFPEAAHKEMKDEK